MNCAANLARTAKLVITFSMRTNPATALGMKLQNAMEFLVSDVGLAHQAPSWWVCE